MKREYVFKKFLWKTLIPALDGLGDALTGGRLKHRGVPKSPRKILVLRCDHLGDGILMLPFLSELRRLEPRAEIWGLFSEEIAPLKECRKFVNVLKILPRNENWLARGRKRFDLAGLANTIRELRREKFDLAIDARGELRNLLFLWLIGAKFRIGYGSAGGGFLLHRELGEKRGEHETERNLRLLGALGHAVGSPEIQISPDPEDAAYFKYLPKGRFLVVHAGAGTPAKRWPKERWEELVSCAVKRGFSVALVGRGKAEEALAERFDGREGVTNYVGSLTLSECFWLIRRSAAFIGCDSGLAHAAGALGAATVVLESGTNESERWQVRGPRVKRIRMSVFCSPCHLTECRFPTHDCMNRITVDRAKEALMELAGAG